MQKPQSSKSGSSPRGRGKRTQSVGRDHGGGLIPARAGKTASWRWPSLPVKAHPRVGGENGGQGGDRRPLGGSSPRGRGKREVGLAPQLLQRLIPARAGKTGWPSARPGASPAHPRAGGENILNRSPDRLVYGSSPRGRGKRRSRVVSVLAPRLIPARAGKTAADHHDHCHGTAHPRAGGENPRVLVRVGVPSGSSPRGRGKRRRCR